MRIKEIVQQLESSPEFAAWRETHQAFLAALLNETEWQLGYYDPEQDCMTMFTLNPIRASPPEKVFREPDKTVQPLHLNTVRIDLQQALDIAAELQRTKYPREIPVKIIAILQHLELGQLYNITYVTRTLNALNIKIDAANGAVLQDSVIAVAQFR